MWESHIHTCSLVSLNFRVENFCCWGECNTPLFPEIEPNPLSFSSSFTNSTLPSISHSLTFASISPTLLLDQVLERKPRLSLLLPPLIASHLLGKSSLQFKVWFQNSTWNSVFIQSLTQCSSFLCDWMMNSSRLDWGILLPSTRLSSPKL